MKNKEVLEWDIINVYPDIKSTSRIAVTVTHPHGVAADTIYHYAVEAVQNEWSSIEITPSVSPLAGDYGGYRINKTTLAQHISTVPAEKITWRVTENNGGGLTLYVWVGEKLIFAHAGYEFTPDNLRVDIAGLRGGDDTSDWEGNDLVDEDIVRACRIHQDDQDHDYVVPEEIEDKDGNIIPLTTSEYYDDDPSTNVICNQDGPSATDEMGAAGKSAFYPEEK